MKLSAAIDQYKAEMKRGQFAEASQDRYGRGLERFMEHIGDIDISLVDVSKCRAYIDTFDHHAPATIGLTHTIMTSFFKFLVLDEAVERNPMDRVRRPKIPALRDRKRTRITSEEVQTMLSACRGWSEILCLSVLAYTGVRRRAAARLRWRDVDGKAWTITFQEKGRKRITKPVAQELRTVLTRYVIERSNGGDPVDADEWVIPNRRDMGRKVQRSDRLVYNIVKAVAARCEIKAHVHAFRAAFAVHFLRTNPDHLEALRQSMGHASIQTTLGYLDELQGPEAMKLMTTLSWEAA